MVHFFLSALEGDIHRLSKLLKKINVDVVDSSGYSSLHYASRAGRLDIVKCLVENGANVNLLTRGNQSSPLHRASQQGHADVVEYLLKNGAIVTLKDSDGFTPLHRAVLGNHNRVCKLLVSYDPNLIHVRDSKGRLPKDCCSSPDLEKLF